MSVFAYPTLASVPLFGDRFRVHMQAPNGTLHVATGVYQVVEPPARLVWTWVWETDAKESVSWGQPPQADL